ncbi:MAG: efflux RND transporter periplasmic adaptor subunit [Thermodesulfobacteriota bacterium]|nr:MAG: efflux RND transporter periplasmic adaptor subunit [Thermodesulfobacteriota bacterium]
MPMRKSAYAGPCLIFLIFCVLLPGVAPAQEPPPALVVAAPVASGKIAEETEFVGTVYYTEVSDVAAEVRGKVEEVRFEEGMRIKEGTVLVRLASDLLERSIASTEASYGQAMAELERAELDFKRIEPLYRQGLASAQSYDDARLRALGLRNNGASLMARLESLRVELGKKEIRAPFDGVVLERRVDRGEWVEAGGQVARFALFDEVDIIVNVPQDVVRFVKTGMEAAVSAGGRVFTGKVTAIVPSGDIRTRTFPVKVRVRNDSFFAEGMDARVSLPRGEKVDAFIVPRDAITSKFGSIVVFVAEEGKARMIPVEVVGYSGLAAGVRGEGLKDGMDVVVKGNERLNDGQPVNVVGADR